MNTVAAASLPMLTATSHPRTHTRADKTMCRSVFHNGVLQPVIDLNLISSVTSSDLCINLFRKQTVEDAVKAQLHTVAETPHGARSRIKNFDEPEPLTEVPDSGSEPLHEEEAAAEEEEGGDSPPSSTVRFSVPPSSAPRPSHREKRARFKKALTRLESDEKISEQATPPLPLSVNGSADSAQLNPPSATSNSNAKGSGAIATAATAATAAAAAATTASKSGGLGWHA